MFVTDTRYKNAMLVHVSMHALKEISHHLGIQVAGLRLKKILKIISLKKKRIQSEQGSKSIHQILLISQQEIDPKDIAYLHYLYTMEFAIT